MNRATNFAGVKKAAIWVATLASVCGLAAPLAAQAVTPVARIRRTVLVSLEDRKLAVLENGVVLRVFSVSVGAGVSPSPVGEFEIVNRVANPTYYHKGTVIAAGTNNPLGPRWLGLNVQGYGIHGTNQPKSIGHAASHGCIRLNNHDIVALYPMLAVGDVVEIRATRDEQTAQVFGVFDHATLAEVHAPAAGSSGGGR